MKSGIYKIENLVNGKFYIGSALNLEYRKSTHFSTLEKGTHHNLYLNNSYKKYGKENFIFKVIEFCNKEELILLEQKYIDSLKPEYNICKIAGSTMGRKASDITKEKLSKSHKGLKRSEETKEKMRESRKYQKFSEETRIKMSKSAKLRDFSDNIIRLNKFIIGSNNPRATINEVTVIEIRKSLENGFTIKQLSEKYSVSKSIIQNIKSRRTWKHI